MWRALSFALLGCSLALSPKYNGASLDEGASSEDSSDEILKRSGEKVSRALKKHMNSHGVWQVGSMIQGDNVGDRAGQAVALSDDGKVVAIRMPGHHNATGHQVGVTKVFDFDGNVWTQRGDYIEGTGHLNPWADMTVSISGDGSHVAYGLPHGHFHDVDRAGAVRVFRWEPTGRKDGEEPGKGTGVWRNKGADHLIAGYEESTFTGHDISLNVDGRVIGVGKPFNDDNNDQTNTSILGRKFGTPEGPGGRAGGVQIFDWDAERDCDDDLDEDGNLKCRGEWFPRGEILGGDNTHWYAGKSVSMSSDGLVVAFGVSDRNGSAAFRVYEWDSHCGEGEDCAGKVSELTHCKGEPDQFRPECTGKWVVRGTVEEYGEMVYATNGSSISLSGDGSTVAFGGMGRVEVYHWSVNKRSWYNRQHELGTFKYIRGAGQYRVSLSHDGSTVAYAVPGDDITQGGESVRAYYWVESEKKWKPKGMIVGTEPNDLGFGGGGLALNADGSEVAVGFIQVVYNCYDYNYDTFGADYAVVDAKEDVGTEPAKKYVRLRKGANTPDTQAPFRDCSDGDGTGAVRLYSWDLRVPWEEKPAPVMVHGDPMLKVNGSGTHFWLAPGKLSPLLLWSSPEGATMQLLGKTFHSADARNQWFDQFVITQDGAEARCHGSNPHRLCARSARPLTPSACCSPGQVLDVAVKESPAVGRQISGTMDVKVDGKAVDHGPKPSHASLLFSSAKASARALMSKRSDGFSDILEASAGGLSLGIYSSKAEKFDTARMAKRYMHLNVKFENGFPEGARGMFTELAGSRQISPATKALLKAPAARAKKAGAHRHRTDRAD